VFNLEGCGRNLYLPHFTYCTEFTWTCNNYNSGKKKLGMDILLLWVLCVSGRGLYYEHITVQKSLADSDASLSII